MKGTLIITGIFTAVIAVIALEQSSHKERQCAEIGGNPIYSIVGLFSSCVAQAK